MLSLFWHIICVAYGDFFLVFVRFVYFYFFRRDSFSIELMGGSSEDMEDIVDWGGRG